LKSLHRHHLLRPLVDQDLAVVFYDMTTIRAAGLSEQEDDVRQFGMSKEGVVARQVMLGVVQTAKACRCTTRCLTEIQRRSPHSRASSKELSNSSRSNASSQWLTEACCLPTTWLICRPSRCQAVPGRRYGDFGADPRAAVR